MGLQLCFSEGGDSYDWNPIMQTILVNILFFFKSDSQKTFSFLDSLLPFGSRLQPIPPPPSPPPPKLRLWAEPGSSWRWCLLPDAEAEADPLGYYGLPLAYHTGYPNWPGVQGLGFSSTCYGCRGKRSAEPVYGLPLLRAYHHAPLPLPFLHHLVPTATGEVNESGAGYEVKQTHGFHASSFQSVTRGEVAEPAAEEEA